MLIGCTVILSGTATSAYAFLLVWVTVYAFYFLPSARAVPQLVLMFVVYAGALLISPGSGSQRAVHFVVASGTLLVTAAFVGLLKARVDRLVLTLTEAARRDFLTGLLNRRGFEDAFENELERVPRGSRPLSLLVIDIDHFKEVNDRFGHHVGDDVLERVALALDGVGRRIDTTARTGGEEFAMVLPDTDARSAYVVGERVRAAVRAAVERVPPLVTISVGLATFPEDGRDAQALMRASDQALYSAKRLGRDRVVVYSPDLATVLTRAETQGDDRAASELATGLTLAAAVDRRDEGAAHHSRSVGHYAQLAARELGLPEDRVERVRLAGLLHDVGRIGIPDRILHKPGPLDPIEWEQVREHPEIGARLLVGEELGDIRAWVLAHHERPDGGGYPYGLAAPAIPLEAMILAVADAFEGDDHRPRVPAGDRVPGRRRRTALGCRHPVRPQRRRRVPHGHRARTRHASPPSAT